MKMARIRGILCTTRAFSGSNTSNIEKKLTSPRLNATSDLNYTIIVNPDSGPGNDSVPNDDYVPAIQRLNAFPNARTVGYVRTNYTLRPLADVLQDISTYSGWANSSQGIEMHGIFFDEAVHEYTPEAAEYMKEANDAVRAASGFAGEKTVRTILEIHQHITAHD